MPGTRNRLEEYKEAATLHRLHITLMFGQATVALAASGVLLGALANSEHPPAWDTAILLGVAGLLVTLVFFVISERAAAFSHRGRTRAAELEGPLGFALYSRQHEGRNWPFLTAINATRALYSGMALLWLVSIASHLLNP